MLLLKDAGSRVSWRHVVRMTEIGLITLCIVVVIFYFRGGASQLSFKPLREQQQDVSAWQGWSKTEYLFVFGDSYTDQGFDPSGAQPTPLNPFGNPDAALALTLSTVWLHFLSLTYNQSYVRTYNFAVGGSVIDPSIVPPLFYLHSASLKVQLSEKFKALYSQHPAAAPWTSTNSLFALWFGINDIVLSSANKKRTPLMKLMVSYRKKLETLYGAGARNFLLINVPPTYKGHEEAEYALREKDNIDNWNKHLVTLRNEFVAAHEDLTAFVFDVHTLWYDIFQDNKHFAQTANLTQLGAPCQQYKIGGPSLDLSAPECTAPANQYFFQNELHTTYVPHNLTAAKIVEDCLAPVERKGYCF